MPTPRSPFEKPKPIEKKSPDWFLNITISSLVVIMIVFILLFIPAFSDVMKENPGKEVYLRGRTIKDSGFQNSSVESILASQSKVKKFANYDELKKFLKKQQKNHYRYNYGYDLYGSSFEGDLGVIGDDFSSNASLKTLNYSDNTDYSKTNVQVEGVDEADIVKTDGKYIYIVSGQSVYIIDAYPAEKEKVLAQIKLNSQPREIYVSDNRLVVYGRDREIVKKSFYKKFQRPSYYGFVKIFDISNKENPVQIKDLDFEGRIVSTRLIGDYLYLITSQKAYYYKDELPVPRILSGEKVLNEKIKVPVYYVDSLNRSYGYTSISSVNIKDPREKVNTEVYLLDRDSTIYVSQNNIYLTYNKGLNEGVIIYKILYDNMLSDLPKDVQRKIKEINGISEDILSDEEKMEKAMNLLENYLMSLSEKEQLKLSRKALDVVGKNLKIIIPKLNTTVIHKILIDNGKIKYQNSNDVPGYVLNQFSMDEYKGNFRIATSKRDYWNFYRNFMEAVEEVKEMTKKHGESYVFDKKTEKDLKELSKKGNNVYVLDKDMKLIGKLEGLAPEERIYSARFMGDRVYLVTFKEMDPLFAIDLSDPKNPNVLGKLKIPGYSSYLHPYNENLIIGIGREVENRRNKGVKISLFDVSDVNNLKEVDNYVLGGAGSYSEALRDHKAVLFSKEKNLLVIPVSEYGKTYSEGEGFGTIFVQNYLFEAAVFKVTEKGIELKGKITHNVNVGQKEDDHSAKENLRNVDLYRPIRRSLYIDNTLYTVSPTILKANDLNDLKEIKTINFVDFKKRGKDYEIIK